MQRFVDRSSDGCRSRRTKSLGSKLSLVQARGRRGAWQSSVFFTQTGAVGAFLQVLFQAKHGRRRRRLVRAWLLNCGVATRGRLLLLSWLSWRRGFIWTRRTEEISQVGRMRAPEGSRNVERRARRRARWGDVERGGPAVPAGAHSVVVMVLVDEVRVVREVVLVARRAGDRHVRRFFTRRLMRRRRRGGGSKRCCSSGRGC